MDLLRLEAYLKEQLFGFVHHLRKAAEVGIFPTSLQDIFFYRVLHAAYLAGPILGPTDRRKKSKIGMRGRHLAKLRFVQERAFKPDSKDKPDRDGRLLLEEILDHATNRRN